MNNAPSKGVSPGLILSFLLICAGWLLDFLPVMVLGMIVGGTVGVIWMYRTTISPSKGWSLSDLHGGALLAWSFLGSSYSLLTSDLANLGLQEHEALGQILVASAFILLSCFFLIPIAAFERPAWRDTVASFSEQKKVIDFGTILVLVILFLVIVRFLATGELSFRNIGTSEGSKAITRIAYNLLLATSGLIGWTLGTRRDISLPLRGIIVAGYLPLLSIVLVSQGRREMLAHALMLLIGFAWSRNWRPTMLKTVGLVAALIPFLVIGSLFFEAMRADTRTYRGLNTDFRPIAERVNTATERLENDLGGVWEKQIAILPRRTFLMSYLIELMHPPIDPGPSYGANSLAQITMGIPSAILADKVEVIADLGGFDEDRDFDYGKFIVADEGPSILTSSYMDFRWVGVILGPLLIGITGLVYAWLSRQIRGGSFRLMFMTAVFTSFVVIDFSFFLGAMTVLITGTFLLLISLLMTVLSGSVARRSRDPHLARSTDN